ncbi:MAG: metal ABC transporter ATP-binding protein [Gammaproteobacteria bacterium]|jgi:zinc transport system ATP-binding protein
MGQEDSKILEVRDLNVTIEGQLVLENLSFSLQRGEVMTILGPNGAGKTMLLRALLGAVPYEGQVSWQKGLEIGYVPQRLPYIRNIPLSVADFFALRTDVSTDVREMLQAVGLEAGTENKLISDFSSGQFQRILIAWALAKNPDVLLFDEPTTGVDVGGEETVYSLLTRLQRERNLTMVLITHDLAVVHRLSSVVLCLNKQLVCMGHPLATLTPENLRRLYGTEVKFYQHHHGH